MSSLPPTPSHPHTLTSSHSHPHTHIPTPSHPHTLTSPHPHTLTSSHPHTLTPSHSHPHTLTLSHPHTLTLSHRACRPHSGGHSHPGGEDEQCGERGEQTPSHFTLPSLPHTLHTLPHTPTHSPHTPTHSHTLPHTPTHSHTLPSQAAMESGFQDHIPCHTVTMACISSNAAIATGAKHNSLSSHQPPSLTPFPPHILPPSHPSPLTPFPLTPFPPHTLSQVFVRLPQDRVTW